MAHCPKCAHLLVRTQRPSAVLALPDACSQHLMRPIHSCLLQSAQHSWNLSASQRKRLQLRASLHSNLVLYQPQLSLSVSGARCLLCDCQGPHAINRNHSGLCDWHPCCRGLLACTVTSSSCTFPEAVRHTLRFTSLLLNLHVVLMHCRIAHASQVSCVLGCIDHVMVYSLKYKSQSCVVCSHDKRAITINESSWSPLYLQVI